jgi:hypothetical protein
VSEAIGAAHDDRRQTMKYLLALIGDESSYLDVTPEQRQESMKAWDAFTRDLTDAGGFVAGEGLQPSATATTVDLRGSGPVVSDGPFAETKEQLGGFYLIECANLDDALSWAKRIPMPGGVVEVRPVMDYEAAGSEAHSNEAEVAR